MILQNDEIPSLPTPKNVMSRVFIPKLKLIPRNFTFFSLKKRNLDVFIFFPVLLPWSSEPRGGMEVPGRGRHPGGQAQGQVRRLLQEVEGHRQGRRQDQGRPQDRQEDREVPEGHRGLRIRLSSHRQPYGTMSPSLTSRC